MHRIINLFAIEGIFERIRAKEIQIQCTEDLSANSLPADTRLGASQQGWRFFYVELLLVVCLTLGY